jgi:hypothetical protein
MMNSKIVFSLVVAATFALCGTDAISAPKPPLKIVIVGDDTLRTIVLDYSPVPCGPSPYPTPCYYEAGSAAAYPGILGSISASEVTALSPLGSASGTDPTARPIPVVLESQVPQIASDADVVFVNVGASEVAAGRTSQLGFARGPRARESSSSVCEKHPLLRRRQSRHGTRASGVLRPASAQRSSICARFFR